MRADHLEAFKAEIKRAYRVLGGDNGLNQNARDIHAWRIEGRISADEHKELRAYNRSLYHYYI